MDQSQLNDISVSLMFRMLMVAHVQVALHPGAWFVTLSLENAYWYIPTDSRYRRCLAVELKVTVLQLTVLPFGINIVLEVFTKMMKPRANALSHLSAEIQMYHDDWLIQAPALSQCTALQDLPLLLVCQKGFLINHVKPTLSQHRQLSGSRWNGTPGQFLFVCLWTTVIKCCPRCAMP